MSFGRTGVSWIWTFHFCPTGSGCMTMYWPARLILTGRRPNLTTLPTPIPIGTVQRLSPGAFQLAVMLPE